MVEDMRGLTDRVEEAETRVGHVEDMTLELSQEMMECMKRQRVLQNKLTDLESRSRRNNMRIFGVDEREQPKSMVQFMTDFLQRELKLPADLDLKIQRAHRIPTAARPGISPRPIIINFQEFTTKEFVLREAWKKGRIQLHDRAIYFDNDYATEVVQKRREYQKIKKILKERGIRFQTPYTSIRIHWEDGAGVYSNAREAGLELRKRGLEVELPAEGNTQEDDTRLRKLSGWQRKERPSRKQASASAQRVKERLKEFERGNGK